MEEIWYMLQLGLYTSAQKVICNSHNMFKRELPDMPKPMGHRHYIGCRHTVRHENLMVVKFYGSPLNRLDEKLLEF